MGMAVTAITDMDLASVAIMEGTFDMVDFRHVVIQFFCADTMADTANTSTDTDIIMAIIDEKVQLIGSSIAVSNIRFAILNQFIVFCTALNRESISISLILFTPTGQGRFPIHAFIFRLF